MPDFLFFFLKGPCRAAWGILVPWPGIKLVPPALEGWNLNHWIAREVSKYATTSVPFSAFYTSTLKNMEVGIVSLEFRRPCQRDRSRWPHPAEAQLALQDPSLRSLLLGHAGHSHLRVPGELWACSLLWSSGYLMLQPTELASLYRSL